MDKEKTNNHTDNTNDDANNTGEQANLFKEKKGEHKYTIEPEKSYDCSKNNTTNVSPLPPSCLKVLFGKFKIWFPEKTKITDWLIIAVTAAIFFAGILQYCEMRTGTGYTDNLAKAAQRANEIADNAFREDRRPWVGFQYQKGFQDNGTISNYDLVNVVKNTGKTPATGVTFKHAVYTGKKAKINNINTAPFNTVEIIADNIALAPESEIKFYFIRKDSPTWEEQRVNIDLVIYAVGEIAYRDTQRGRDNEVYITEYCFYKAYRDVFRSCPKGNYMK